MKKLKVGSLFAGIGGIDLGFEQAGFEIAWANEIDAAACKTYRHNFSDTLLIEDDIRIVDPSLLSDVDVITAGFPCQPFSVMGYKRGFKDPRGNLFFEIARFVDTKKPSVVFLENVANLVEHDNGRTFQVIYKTLVELGYYICYRVINATDMDLPQNRARIYIVAFRDYELSDRFTFPEAVPLTCSIEDVLDRTVRHSDVYYYTEENRYFSELNRKIPDKSGIYRIDDSGVATRKYDVCPTLKANMGTYHDRVPIIRDDYGIRKLTPRECLDFQGFPETFDFKGISLDAAYKQIGNSVAVPVIKNIAELLKIIMV